ncbi:MAG: hypothetical protein Fur0024_5330 [Patescibacteria group bacterium]
MKNENKKSNLKGILIGSVATLAVVISTTAMAYRGDATKTGPNYDEATHEAVESALEKGDYNAWKEVFPGKGRVLEVITKDNFGKFAEMHKLREEGKIEEANAIRAELGLGQGEMRRGGGRGAGRGQNMQNKNFVDINNDGRCDNIES